MGLQDFYEVFDTLDRCCNGFITVDQLTDYLEELYDGNIPQQTYDHIEKSVHQVTQNKNQNKIMKDVFLDVLKEFERRRSIEEQSYWDFQALDYKENGAISIKDAFLLFREYHGERFSLDTWKRFLSSRRESHSDACFDEIRHWLCALPTDKPSSEKELKEEENNLEMRHQQDSYNEYMEFKEWQGNMFSEENEREKYAEDSKYHADRKLQKWNRYGIEAMLFDDGDDDEIKDLQIKPRWELSIEDIIDVLEIKYERLKNLIISEMAKFESADEDDVLPLFREIKKKELKLCTSKAYQDKIHELPGARAKVMDSLFALIGDLKNEPHKLEPDKLVQKMKQEGKSEADIENELKKHFEELVNGLSGNQSCGMILEELMQRFLVEKKLLVQSINSQNKREIIIKTEYGSIIRQINLLGEEEEFLGAALAVGLAERSPCITDLEKEFDLDLERFRKIASLRVKQRKGREQQKSPGDLIDELSILDKSDTELLVDVITELTKKHFYEREAIIQLMYCKEVKDAKEKAKLLSPDERSRKLRILRNQHSSFRESLPSDFKPSTDSKITSILQKAIGLYHENVRAESGQKKNQSDDVINIYILFLLQQRQEQEFTHKLQLFIEKGSKELIKFLKKENKATVWELYDNIAHVILGSLCVSESEEAYIKIIQKKYDMLREKLLLSGVKDKFGAAWTRLTPEEKKKDLMNAWLEEKRMRGEGNFEGMIKLIGSPIKILPSLKTLMGENRKQFTKRLQSGDSTQGNKESFEDHSINLLADLIPRFDHEQDSLLHHLRMRDFSDAERKRTLVQMNIETIAIKLNEDIETSFLSAGLLERIDTALTKRFTDDRKRQECLAQKRFIHRQKCLDEGNIQRMKDEKELPGQGDYTAWQIGYIKELIMRHFDEREKLLSLYQDDDLDELMEIAASMEDTERQDRLSELLNKRRRLNLELSDSKEENISFLEEAAAIQTVIRKLKLEENSEKIYSLEELCVMILTELQDLQDQELAAALNSVCTLDMDQLKSLYSREVQQRHNESYENVLVLLTSHEGGIPNDEILKIIRSKYINLIEKYLSTLLRNDIVDKQTYERLLKEISSSWLQGDFNRLMKIQNEESLKCEDMTSLFGIDRKSFWQEVHEHEKLSNTKLDVIGTIINEPSYKPENNIKPLTVLWERCIKEQDYWITKLKGYTDEIINNQARQIIVVRLKREVELARKEKDYIFSTLITGLCERQQFEMLHRLTNDQSRLERLANHYCMNSYEKQQAKKAVSPEKDIVILQQALMDLVDVSHNHERILYRDVLSVDISEQQQQFAALYTEQEKHDHLKNLKLKYYSCKNVKVKHSVQQEYNKDNLHILQEAVVIKREMIRHNLCNQSNMREVDDNRVDMFFMSQLIKYQLQESEQYLHTLESQDEHDLIKTQTRLIDDIKCEGCENIAEFVFSLSKMDSVENVEQEMIDALDGKYTALRDKLLLESLMKQFGEKEWQNMSEKERQRKLMELKLKEKRLRKEGKFDEAAALLGDLVNNQETMDKLLGKNRQDYERKLRERLEKRKQRLAEGFSEEECDRLEDEEIKEENKRRNILLELEHRHDEEKDELLKMLLKSGDLQEQEKQRQLEIIRLRLEERKTRLEDKFDSAALALSLAEANQEKWQLSKDEERLRQQRLAKERIAAARGKKEFGVKRTEMDFLQWEDTNDIGKLMEITMKYIEERQQNERNVFIKLLDDGCETPEREGAREITADERNEKLVELSEMRKSWKGQEHRVLDDQMDILKEAVAFKLEEKVNDLYNSNMCATDEEAKISLLAELQLKQSEELKNTLKYIHDKEVEEIRNIAMIFASKETGEMHDNIACILFGEDQKLNEKEERKEAAHDSDQDVIQALEEKYDVLKDKLIAEALMKQIGDAEWKQLSEKERQKKIVQLKLKEKKLREEGRLDEADALLMDLIKNETELNRQLNETREEHKQRVQERLLRRKQLVAEREAAGLSIDDETINEIQDKEEEKKYGINRRKNVLDDLKHNFEEEKAALLASLQNHQDIREREKSRQLALAKLRREQKLLKNEEKFDSAALVLTLADEHEKNRVENLLKERTRQRALAIERLNERKKKRQENMESDEQQLENQLLQGEGNSQPPDNLLDAILTEMDNQHASEQNILLELISASKNDKKNIEKAKKKRTIEDLKTHIQKLEEDRQKWRKQSHMSLSKINEDKMSEKERKKHITAVAKSRASQFKLLTEAMVYRMEAEVRSLTEKKSSLSENELMENVNVSLLTDLQEKQKFEAERMQALLQKQEQKDLENIKKMQLIAGREGWFDNLTSVLFIMSLNEDQDIENLHQTEQQLELEMEKEKEVAIQKAKRAANLGEEIDVDAMLKKLEEEHAAKRKFHMDSLEKQRELIYERLKDRQRARLQKDDDENTAFHLIEMAGQQSKDISNLFDDEKKRQGNKMQERLEARKRARKNRAEQTTTLARDTPDNIAAMFDTRQSSLITPSSERSDISPVPFGLKREKTVLNVDVSEDTKQELYTKLVRQQSNLHRKIEEQQSRQEEILQRRLEARKGKRENEAVALFTLGERQKTILQQTQQEEKDRQAFMIKERVERARYERTKTQRDRSRSRGFEATIGEEDTDITQDELMERKAKELQEKFKAEEQALMAGKSSGGSGLNSGERLDEKKRLDLLKQKRKDRKQRKQKTSDK